MFVRAAIPCVILALASVPLVGQDKQPQGKDSGTNAAFDHFKQLAGEWVGKGKSPKEPEEMVVKYKVTSGGSAVVETIMPGTDHEMVTVIHRDGPDLLLTHYCMLGNQPHMKASGGDGKKVEFKFVKATNMKSDKDMHMHDVTYTFVDKDTLKSEWTHYKDGKNAGAVTFELKRKK